MRIVSMLQIVGFMTLMFTFCIWRFFGKEKSEDETTLKDAEIQNRMKGVLLANDSGLVSFISRHYLTPPALKNNYVFNKNPTDQAIAKSSSEKFIQKRIEKVFRDEPPGFFVEAGALDGVFLSNTLWLEKDKGWTGLLIEPNPTNYAALLQVKRRSWSARACLSTSPYPTENVFTVVNPTFDSTNDMYGKKSLLQLLRSQTFEIEKGISTLDTFRPYYASHFVYITAQCFPLESFMLALNVTVIDFLSLDIQGGEWEVLEQFPWDKIKLRTLVVEYVVHLDKIRNRQISLIDFMSTKGYKLVGKSDVPDYIFVHQNETKLLANIL